MMINQDHEIGQFY